MDYCWFPTDGIWLVQITPYSTSKECVLKLGELPELYPYIQLMMDKKELTSYISDCMKVPFSVDDLAKKILTWIARKQLESKETKTC
jgi:hypothetical protein